MILASPRLVRVPLEQRGLTIADFLVPIRLGERLSTRIRHLALIGDHLYVANERSHTVATFAVDAEDGVPRIAAEPAAVPSPTCILRWAPTGS